MQVLCGLQVLFLLFNCQTPDYEAVSADSDMEDLIQKAMNQNFVPVVDDQNKFIGIITRKSIIEYCYEKLKNLPDSY